MDVLRRAVELGRAGAPAALATVAQVRGSVPRHPGARMLVRQDGSSFGTIGGGRVEQEVTREGIDVASGGSPRTLEYHLVRDLAMCCGGSMVVHVEPLGPALEALAAAVERRGQRGPGLLVTPLDGSGKRFVATERHGPRNARVEDGSLIEPLVADARLILFGAGHVGRAIGALAAGVDFQVVACDDDDTGALADPLAWAQLVVPSFEIADVERAVGLLGEGDYALVVTRDHAIDERLIERLLPRAELSYLGLIGSRGKIGRFEKRLRAKGIATDERWARLHAPIGLDIGAETPAEIAVSTVAELIAVRNRGGA